MQRRTEGPLRMDDEIIVRNAHVLDSVLQKSRIDIKGIVFEVNPCKICLANRMKYGKQQTITWHVDDSKSSHVDNKVNK